MCLLKIYFSHSIFWLINKSEALTALKELAYTKHSTHLAAT